MRSCWPTAPRSRARRSAPSPPAGVATGEVVFNTVLTGYQEVITDPSLRRADHHLHLPPHRQLRRQRRRRREPPAVLPRGVIVRDLARRRRNWRATGDLDAFLRRPRRAGHRRHRHPPAHPPHPRGRRHARRLRHGRRGRRSRRPRPPSRAPTASTSSPPSPPPSRTRWRADGRRSRRVVAYDFGIKTHDPPPPVRARDRRGRARRRRRRPRSSPGGPTACSCPTARATRPRSPTPSTPSAACSAACRCSASASATSCWRTALGATTYKLPFGHHGGNHPVRRLPDRPGRDHQPEPQLRRRRGLASGPARRHPRQPERRRGRGPAGRDALRAFSVQYHPEAGPGPHDAALPVRRSSPTSSTRPAGGRGRCPAGPTSSRSC